MVVKAGRGVTAWAGVGKEFQLWIGKSRGGGTKGYAEWATAWLGMAGQDCSSR